MRLLLQVLPEHLQLGTGPVDDALVELLYTGQDAGGPGGERAPAHQGHHRLPGHGRALQVGGLAPARRARAQVRARRAARA